MSKAYQRTAARTFGKPNQPSSPKKRPTQVRARFTVQAIYDGFVRIWERDGWSGISMRMLSEETGYAVGTIYDYFPNREAVLSGYIRNAMEARYAGIAGLAVCGAITLEARIAEIIGTTIGAKGSGAPPLLDGMAELEHLVADVERHRRVLSELTDVWAIALRDVLPANVPLLATCQAMVLAVWGTVRYASTTQSSLLADPAFVERLNGVALHFCS